MAVRIGFVGTGGIAGAHFNSLEKIKDAQPVAFMDLNTERAEAAARRFEGTAYSDAEKMLDNENLDAVYVCLPPHVHQKAEISIAKRGLAMFVEKPLSNDLKLAEKIAAVIEDTGVITGVGYHHRYYESTERLKKALAAKGAAEPAMLYGRWLGNFPGVPWWRVLKQSGGQFVEQTTHVVDSARNVNGEITSVHCVGALREMDKVYEGTTAPDVMAILVTFANGSIGHFSTTCIDAKREVALDIYAKGINYSLSMNTLTITDNVKNESTTFTGTNDAFVAEDTQFIAAVKTKRPAAIKAIRSDYADALKTLRVTLAANQSMKTGKTVKI